MVKDILILGIIPALAFSSTASAQLLGDVNCNGYPWEIQDAVLVARILVEHCDLYVPYCWENSDFDGDGRALTIGDIIYFLHSNYPPLYPNNPQSDTLSVESAVAHPGESFALAVQISTVDTIMGLQFLIDTDTDYIEFDSLVEGDVSQLLYSDCDGDIYCVTGPQFNNPIITDPGIYHICDLYFTVNPDITQPVTTSLFFSSNPPLGLYSGLANSDFFLPVMVDGEIQIIPLTGVESETYAVPADFLISAFPNPFNGALNISVYSENEAEISIYDIIGRPVRTFGINPGGNLIRWDATGSDGRSLSAGIYFIGGAASGKFEKVLYLK